jgi:hypothetical protein
MSHKFRMARMLYHHRLTMEMLVMIDYKAQPHYSLRNGLVIIGSGNSIKVHRQLNSHRHTKPIRITLSIHPPRSIQHIHLGRLEDRSQALKDMAYLVPNHTYHLLLLTALVLVPSYYLHLILQEDQCRR